MRLSYSRRVYVLSLVLTLMLAAFGAGVLQVDSSARAAMNENAVPLLQCGGDSVIELLFGWQLSALRSVVGKIFPYAALVLELLIFIFFAIVEGCV